MRVYIIEENHYDTWLNGILYKKYEDPKEEAWIVNYLRCSDAGSTFPKNILKLEVRGDELIADVIGDVLFRATGEVPHEFSQADIDNEIQTRMQNSPSSKDQLDKQKQLSSMAASRIATHLSVSLVKTPVDVFRDNKHRKSLSEFEYHSAKDFIEDGDILLIRRHSIRQLVEDCQRMLEEAPGLRSGIAARDCDDFFRKIGCSLRDSKKRPQVALLYTDEDTHVASYVRTHFDALDKASGEDCDFLFIENPNSMESSRYWRSFLDEVSLLVWQCLGWTKSKPYDKSHAYEIAKKLSVPIYLLPCAVVLEKTQLANESVIKLENNLTASFREIFAKFQTRESDDITYASERVRPRRDVLSRSML